MNVRRILLAMTVASGLGLPLGSSAAGDQLCDFGAFDVSSRVCTLLHRTKTRNLPPQFETKVKFVGRRPAPFSCEMLGLLETRRNAVRLTEGGESDPIAQAVELGRVYKSALSIDAQRALTIASTSIVAQSCNVGQRMALALWTATNAVILEDLDACTPLTLPVTLRLADICSNRIDIIVLQGARRFAELDEGEIGVGSFNAFRYISNIELKQDRELFGSSVIYRTRASDNDTPPIPRPVDSN